LPSDSILLLEDGHCLRDHALSACNIKNVDKVSNITATSLLTLVQMVDADLGITYLPEMAVNSSLLKNTRIKTTPMEPGSSRQIGLVWRKASTRQDEFTMLGNFIRDNYKLSGNQSV
jgi:LysR family hydrogen peroxide-inducible transcriptional activator